MVSHSWNLSCFELKIEVIYQISTSCCCFFSSYFRLRFQRSEAALIAIKQKSNLEMDWMIMSQWHFRFFLFQLSFQLINQEAFRFSIYQTFIREHGPNMRTGDAPFAFTLLLAPAVTILLHNDCDQNIDHIQIIRIFMEKPEEKQQRHESVKKNQDEGGVTHFFKRRNRLTSKSSSISNNVQNKVKYVSPTLQQKLFIK